MPLGEIIEVGEGDLVENRYVCSTCAYEHIAEMDAVYCCVFECDNCGTEYESESEWQECCAYRCENCGSRYSDPDTAYDCCYGDVHYEEDDPYGGTMYPPGITDVEPEHIVYVPAIEGRPIRVCSIEQELSRGGAPVARMLSDIGISAYDGILNYTFEGTAQQAIVKSDGSLRSGGGEVVYSRFNLGDVRQARRFSKALACIQAMENEGIVEVGTDAGTHIHISALDSENVPYGPAQMAALYEIFSFSEDVIFRMASAGWPGHRGLNYTRIIEKFNRDDKTGITAGKVAKQAQAERYFSLNFRRLLNAVQQCACGACLVGDWEGCECRVLERGTIEWRVFNATTNPKTLHAWVLLAQGITAAAFNHQLHTLSPHEYERTDPELHPWIFGWMLWNCPFEDSERQILFNTAREAPNLFLPWENIDQFHDGWEAMEVPELASRAWDGTFPGCTCETCQQARGAVVEDEGSLTGATTDWTSQVRYILDSPSVIQNLQQNWTSFAQNTAVEEAEDDVF